MSESFDHGVTLIERVIARVTEKGFRACGLGDIEKPTPMPQDVV
jgi:hypothetical protein